MRLISRSEAIAAGLTKYFTGKPCKHGHLCERYVCKWQCIECKASLDRAYEAGNRDRILSRRAKYRDHNRDGIRQADRDFHQRNRERRKALMREYAGKNSAKAVERAREWNKANPESKRTSVRTRRAKKRDATGSHTAADIKTLFQRQNGRCASCAISLKQGYHVDHISPLAKGGSNGPDNLQLLCPPCNQRKGAKDPLIWARENGRLL